ncbi:MAG: ATP-binding protein [Eubacterium sp.]|nr:ATP-binding protein [Eubacterium sp.]
MTKADTLIAYKSFTNENVFRKLTEIIDVYESDKDLLFNYEGDFYSCITELINMAVKYGFSGNLWHNYLSLLIVNNENSYSLSCEISGKCGESLESIALHDFEIIREIFNYPLGEVGDALEVDVLKEIGNYKGESEKGEAFNSDIRKQIVSLSQNLEKAESAEEFKRLAEEFYRKYGVGKLGLHKAFRVEEKDGEAVLLPIANVPAISLDDLVGYESAKKKLTDNTEAFVCKRRANNCLLYGDAGTGKSSSIKAIMNKYYDKGLRIIEIYKHQFKLLNDVISQIKNRNYRFIIYMDDLSFEEFEIEYKYLKAVIEGGLEVRPENILIYATSNRRHLIRETFKDKEDRDEELHTNDTVQEKLSLANRFGVRIYYGSPTPKEFKEIVRVLGERGGVNLTEEELFNQANKWELSHGGLSGRTAQQFIDYLLGQV